MKHVNVPPFSQTLRDIDIERDEIEGVFVKSETCELEKFLLHSNSQRERKVLHRVLMDTGPSPPQKSKQQPNATFCDHNMSQNCVRMSYWVRLCVAKMRKGGQKGAKKMCSRNWCQQTEKILDVIDPRDLHRCLGPIKISEQ